MPDAGTVATVAERAAMRSVIRVMIHAYADARHEPIHVYLGETAALRQDLHGAQ